jgi:hypothetical protein
MWQVVSGTANLLSDCGLQAVVQTVAGDGTLTLAVIQLVTVMAAGLLAVAPRRAGR